VCKSRELSESAASSQQLAEALSRHRNLGIITVKSLSAEPTYSEPTAALLEQWFTPEERGAHGLPTELRERLELLIPHGGEGPPEQRLWKRARGERSLKVHFVPLAGEGHERPWALLLEDVLLGVPMPSVWREQLTPREAEVVERALQYLDNQDIGEQLGCTVATVKKHLQRAFEKLAVENRNMLLYWAVRR
jgi:DNA-binding CsgD family transcriptional regulator